MQTFTPIPLLHRRIRFFLIALVLISSGATNVHAALELVASTSYVMPGAPGRLVNLQGPVALAGGDTVFLADLASETNVQVLVTARDGAFSILRPEQVGAGPGDRRPFLAVATGGSNPLVVARNRAGDTSWISIFRVDAAGPVILVADVLGATRQLDSSWAVDALTAQPNGLALQSHYWPGRPGFVPASSTVSVLRDDKLVPIAVTRSSSVSPEFIGFLAPVLNPAGTRVIFGGVLSVGSSGNPITGIYEWENGVRSTLIDPEVTFNGARVAIASFGMAEDGAIAAVDQGGKRILLWQAGRFTELARAGTCAADGTEFEMGNPLPVPAILRVDSTQVYFTAARRGTGPLGFDNVFQDFVFRVARAGGTPELCFDPRRIFPDLPRIQLTDLSLTGEMPRLTFTVREVFGSQQAIYSGPAPFSPVAFPAVPPGYPSFYLEDRGSGFSTRAGTPRALDARTTGDGAFTYAWAVNGNPIPETSEQYRGAATAALQLAPFAQNFHTGVYTLAVSSPTGTAYATSTVVVDGYYDDGNGELPSLVNASVRGYTAADEGIFTAGITLLPILTGIQYVPEPRVYSWKPGVGQQILIRAVGPGLAPFTRSDVVPAPATELELYSGATRIATNDGRWNSAPGIIEAAAAVGAFSLPLGSRDSAVLVDLAIGMYTAQAAAPAGDGTALIEFYVVSGEGNVRNVSARGFVTDTEPRSLTLEFVIRSAPHTVLTRAVLLRAAGPALAPFGIETPAVRPRLELYSADNILLASNSGHELGPNPDDIKTTARRYGAFPFPPGSADAALLLHLPEGAYVARVTAAPGTPGGVVLAELYTQVGF